MRIKEYTYNAVGKEGCASCRPRLSYKAENYETISIAVDFSTHPYLYSKNASVRSFQIKVSPKVEISYQSRVDNKIIVEIPSIAGNYSLLFKAVLDDALQSTLKQPVYLKLN